MIISALAMMPMFYHPQHILLYGTKNILIDCNWSTLTTADKHPIATSYIHNCTPKPPNHLTKQSRRITLTQQNTPELIHNLPRQLLQTAQRDSSTEGHANKCSEALTSSSSLFQLDRPHLSKCPGQVTTGNDRNP